MVGEGPTQGIYVLVCSLLLTACAGQSPTPFPSATPTQTPIPSATTVWFPATDTPVVLPTATLTPIPDYRPGIGGLIFRDDFSESGFWTLASGANRSAAIANGHLTLTTKGDRVVLFSLRNQPTLGDFYLEVTVDANICTGKSEYGVMMRTTSTLDQYRFAISCDGQAHADRIYKSTASAAVPWERFSFLPTIAPSTSTLGIWANAKDIRFFVDGHYVLSIRDTLFYQGTLGLYVRSGDGSPVSVNFSQLEVYEILP